jgi:hypothetical protein
MLDSGSPADPVDLAGKGIKHPVSSIQDLASSNLTSSRP